MRVSVYLALGIAPLLLLVTVISYVFGDMALDEFVAGTLFSLIMLGVALLFFTDPQRTSRSERGNQPGQ